MQSQQQSFDFGNLPPELLQWHLQQQQGQQQQQQQQQQADQPSSSTDIKSEPQEPPLSHETTAQQESSCGPIRSKASASKIDPHRQQTSPPPDSAVSPASSSNNHKASSSSAKKIQPVRAACLFCRARKSRCDGRQPCHNCINRGREDDCVFTVSRRGGKPKPKPNQSQEEANLELHLKRLFNLSQLPQKVRVPGAIPQLAEAQQEQTQQREGSSPVESQPQQASTDPSSSIPAQPPTQFDPQMFAAAAAAAGAQPAQHQQYNFGSPGLDSNPSSIPQLQQQPSSWSDPMTTALFNAMNQGYGAPGAGQPTFDPNAFPSQPFASAFSPQQQQQQQQQMQQMQQQLSQQQNQQWQPMQAQDSQTSQPTASGPVAPIADTTDVYTILLGYYNSLYRFIPVFVPPQYIDQMASRLSPESPFILALRAILPLLQSGDAEEGTSQTQSFAAGFGVGPGNSGLAFASPERKRELLQLTSHYERRASDAIETVLERAESQLHGDASGNQITNLGSTFGVIQALAVLCVYHYGNGRALKARLKADQALGLAMAKGLHRLKRPSTTASTPALTAAKSSFVSASSDPFGNQTLWSDLPEDVVYEMKKRIWWTCWSSSLWCSYNTAIVPTIRADDPRVRTEMPTSVDATAWPANIKSLQSLLLIQERVLALANFKDGQGENGHEEDGMTTATPTTSHHPRQLSSGRTGSTLDATSNLGDAPSIDSPAFASLPPHASRSDVLDSMLEIDKQLQEQIEQMESDEEGFKQLCAEPPSISLQGTEALGRVEEDLATYLRRSAAIQLYTSSLTLHLGQAFQGASLFERKLCFLNTVTENDTSAACQVPMPDSFATYFDQGQSGQPQLEQQQQQQEQQEQQHQHQQQLSSGSNTQQLWDDWIRTQSPPRQTTQDLFARGPFLPKDSLRRCVHASKRLLEIARSKRKEPNPFNACSFVLISFTLLMQALAVSGSSGGGGGDQEEGGDDDEEGEDEDGEADGSGDQVMSMLDEFGSGDGDFDLSQFLKANNGTPQADNSSNTPNTLNPLQNADFQAFSRGILHSAQGAAALGGSGGNNTNATASFGGNATNAQGQHLSPDQLRKRQRLMEIWSRVREAHATLKELSRYWKMVEPMADEVSLCLETSQLLL